LAWSPSLRVSTDPLASSSWKVKAMPASSRRPAEEGMVALAILAQELLRDVRDGEVLEDAISPSLGEEPEGRNGRALRAGLDVDAEQARDGLLHREMTDGERGLPGGKR